MRRALVGMLAVTTAVACVTGTGARGRASVGRTSRGEIAASVPGRGARDVSRRFVRIALATRATQVRLTAGDEWSLAGADDRTLTGVLRARESWILDADGARVRGRREDSAAESVREPTVIVRPADEGGILVFNGRAYRGELWISPGDGGLLVVNRLRMDDYVKGVVPLEIGTSAGADAAAVEAQAVTARSYAYMHLAGPSQPYDMVATVEDQVYGGVGAETTTGNRAVDATAGMVLLYNGRVVNTPYHANCGGTTAEPGDAWRSGPEPYLRRVSDEIPGTSRFYCDWAPRYRWTRRYTGEELRQSIVRYVRGSAGGGERAGDVAVVRVVTVSAVTPAGRVAALTIDTDRGRWVLRGNEVRHALRTASGEMLYSTYFSVDARTGRDGVETLVLQGGGNGHGVGMCQAGAIGRARAGQDFRTILRTYYPGTTIGPVE